MKPDQTKFILTLHPVFAVFLFLALGCNQSLRTTSNLGPSFEVTINETLNEQNCRSYRDPDHEGTSYDTTAVIRRIMDWSAKAGQGSETQILAKKMYSGIPNPISKKNSGSEQILLVCDPSGKLISAAIFILGHEVVKLEHLITDPQTRGLGVRKAAIKEIIRLAIQNNKDLVELHADFQSDKEFYEKLGFEAVENSNHLILDRSQFQKRFPEFSQNHLGTLESLRSD